MRIRPPAIFLLAMLLCWSCTHTPPIRSASSIAEIAFVSLGSLEQRIIIRGQDRANPILLFVHGGPGTPETPMFTYFNRDLEKSFIVVVWEQRGAGHSFRKGIEPASMTIGSFVSDGNELADYLRHRFAQERIFILGHSWGTILSLKMVQQHLDWYYAYIGTGQIGSMAENEGYILRKLLSTAAERNDARAIAELRSVSAPPYETYDGSDIEKVKVTRKWVRRYGFAIHGKKRLRGLGSRHGGKRRMRRLARQLGLH